MALMDPTAHQTAGPATLAQNSASLEGHGAALENLRLARGLVAPSGEVPSRSRAGRPLERGGTRSGAGRPLERGSASLEDLMGPMPPYLLPRQEHSMH
jgi:hypothetical protein